jgi:tetratricopeptide (TPR) repeat protein
MKKRLLRITSEWALPWIIGVGLIWSVTTSADAAGLDADSGDAGTPPPGIEELEPANLYDMAALPRKIRKIAFRAATYGKRNQQRKAVDLLEGHLRDHPDQDHYLLRLHLAQNQSDLDLTEAAKENYARAVELEPRLDRGWFGLADAAYELEDFATAGRAFENGYRVSPERPVEVLYFSGASYLQAEMPAKSFEVFEQLVTGRSAMPQMKWYQGAVIAAARMGHPEAADPIVAQMIEIYAEDPEAWYLKYQHEAGKKDYEEATVALRLVGYLRELSESEQKQLGDLYLALGVPFLASESYASVVAEEGTVDEYERLGSALVAAHETDRALSVLQEALDEVESDRLWSLLGDIHYLRKEYAPARDAFGRIAADDESGRAWLMQGYCALELGEKEAALDLLARATDYPDQAEMAQILLQRAMKL